MTAEEFTYISKECGFNCVEGDKFIFIVLNCNRSYWFSYYSLKQNEIRISKNVILDIELNRILPSGGVDWYVGVNLDKEYYRNRMLNLQKEIKKLKIKLKRNELEKDFV